MTKKQSKILLICVHIGEGKFRWFWDSHDARVFAMTLYNSSMVIMNEDPIFEHWLEIGPGSICKFLNEREK